MRRMILNQRRRGPIRGLLVASALAWTAMLLAAAPAMAASFDPVFGFDSGDLGDLDSLIIAVPDDEFYMAGEAGAVDVELTGSTNICLFTASNPTCRSNTAGVNGPYSVFVTVEITAVNVPAIDGPFTLFLSGLNGTTYAASEVSVDLDSTVPAGLDTSGIDDFNPRPFLHIIDESDPQDIYHYIGWTVQLGDTVSFRYDVSTAPGRGRSVPQLTANAVAPIVPEPGTALLMGLGLAALATRKRSHRTAVA